jgi:hypothetical protein
MTADSEVPDRLGVRLLDGSIVRRSGTWVEDKSGVRPGA